MPDEFQSQLDQARQARGAKEAAAQRAAEELQQQTRQAQQEAQALLPELTRAAQALQATRRASVPKLLQSTRPGDVSLWRKKGFLGVRVVGWTAGGLGVPFHGEATAWSRTFGQVPVSRYAAIGLEQYGTYDGTNGHQTHTKRVPDIFRAAITAIAKHLAQIER